MLNSKPLQHLYHVAGAKVAEHSKNRFVADTESETPSDHDALRVVAVMLHPELHDLPISEIAKALFAPSAMRVMEERVPNAFYFWLLLQRALPLAKNVAFPLTDKMLAHGLASLRGTLATADNAGSLVLMEDIAAMTPSRACTLMRAGILLQDGIDGELSFNPLLRLPADIEDYLRNVTPAGFTVRDRASDGDLRHVWPHDPDCIGDRLWDLQAPLNDGRGVSCVRSLCTYLRRHDIDAAQAVADNESDKLSNYPTIVDVLKECGLWSEVDFSIGD